MRTRIAPLGGSKNDGESAARSRRIGAIEVGFRLLRVLETTDGKLSLKELAERAGMPPSKAHAYVASFVHEGMMARDPVSGHYGLGPLALQLGVAAMRHSDLIALARPEAFRLRDATSCSVFLATWGNRGPTIVFKIDGKRPPVPVPVGYVLPIFNSATGRVFLAHLPHDETEPLLASELRGEKRRGRAIEAVLSAVRREGFAQMEEGATFSGLSAPVLAHDGRIAAALTMSRPNGSGAAERTRLARLLVAAAAAISAKLGYAPR